MSRVLLGVNHLWT